MIHTGIETLPIKGVFPYCNVTRDYVDFAAQSIEEESQMVLIGFGTLCIYDSNESALQ